MKNNVLLWFIGVLLTACSGQGGARTEPSTASSAVHAAPLGNGGMSKGQVKRSDGAKAEKHLEFLKKFTLGHSKARLTIQEFPDYYKITVHHESSETMSGGAECYRLDKKTGKTTMIWHEHPQPMPRMTPVPVKRP